MIAPVYCFTGLQELHKNDQILAHTSLDKFSLDVTLQSTPTNPTEWMLYSDMCEYTFPSYLIDDQCKVRPGPDTPKVNFTWLKKLLLSQDLSRNEELSWISGANSLRFLDGKSIFGQQVSFQSMPRSGNSFLRRILELVTGVYSGSDMSVKQTGNLVFGSHMAGEETVSHENLCWITKTHWPTAQSIETAPFAAQKCISIARNPIDVIPSFASLKETTSHHLQCNEHFYEVDPEWWNKFATNFANAIGQSYIVNTTEMHPVIPTFYLRYEDLVLDPEPILRDLFCFLLEV